jgi:mannan endo-1,4-beta-mannosidase
MSAYIKEIDPNHLVTWGGEGDFNIESDDWAYNGKNGGDFSADIALDTIDFGTFHSYPDWWSKTVEWTDQWIKDHAEAARKANKPVLHEEVSLVAVNFPYHPVAIANLGNSTGG